jgi:hypothetical protein
MTGADNKREGEKVVKISKRFHRSEKPKFWKKF